MPPVGSVSGKVRRLRRVGDCCWRAVRIGNTAAAVAPCCLDLEILAGGLHRLGKGEEELCTRAVTICRWISDRTGMAQITKRIQPASAINNRAVRVNGSSVLHPRVLMLISFRWMSGELVVSSLK